MRRTKFSKNLRLLMFILAPGMLSVACALGSPGSDQGSSSGGNEQLDDSAPEASLTGWAWLDADEDGIQDEPERVGVQGVVVLLRNPSDEMIDRTETDNDGAFDFGSIPLGEYIVEFQPAAQYFISPQDQGEDDAIDSDADPETGVTDPFSLAERGSQIAIDVGLSSAPATDLPPTPTPLIYLPGGEYQYSGNFTNGSGECGMNPAPFFLPQLLVRIDGDQMQLEQPGAHLNEGIIDQATGQAEVSTGEGADTEGYQLQFDTDLSAAGVYRYTTGGGTCTWDAELELIPQ